MDFRHLIVTCLFSMLRLSFETQKIKENYAIFSRKSVFIATPISLSCHFRTKGMSTYSYNMKQIVRISFYFATDPSYKPEAPNTP